MYYLSYYMQDPHLKFSPTATGLDTTLVYYLQLLFLCLGKLAFLQLLSQLTEVIYRLYILKENVLYPIINISYLRTQCTRIISIMLVHLQ